jgi:preprotein translocase subunit SecY
LGLPSFFSNLQVTWFFLIWLYFGRNIVFALTYFQYQALVDEMAHQLRSQGASVPRKSSVSDALESSATLAAGI